MPRFTGGQQFTSSPRRVCLSCPTSRCSALRCPLSVPLVTNAFLTFDQLAQTKRHSQTEADFKMILQEQYARTANANFQTSSTESLVIGCPVCGRPARIRQQLIGEEVACGHCHGTFVVTEQVDGRKTARSTTASQQPEEQQMPSRSAPLQPPRQPNGLLQPNQLDQSASQHFSFVVKPCHEVYALLASDLIAAGYRVIRALAPADTQTMCSPPSGGSPSAIRRLFLHAEEFEFFTDSFAYQRRVCKASLAIAHQRNTSWK